MMTDRKQLDPAKTVMQCVDEGVAASRKLLARYAVESYLQQILRFGFFHAGARSRARSLAVALLS